MNALVWAALVPILVTMIFSILAYSVSLENRASIRKIECADLSRAANTAALVRNADSLDENTRALQRAPS